MGTEQPRFRTKADVQEMNSPLPSITRRRLHNGLQSMRSIFTAAMVVWKNLPLLDTFENSYVLGPSAGTSDIMKVIVSRWVLS